MMYEELGQEKDKTDWASATRIKSNKNTGNKREEKSYQREKGKKKRLREEPNGRIR